MGFPLSSSLACSRINFGRVIFPCFKWAPLNHSSPLATDSLHGRARSLARAALFFSYKLFCCQAGSIQLCYASLPPLHLCSTWEFFIHYILSAHTRRSALCTTCAFICIYIRQHQSLYSWGDGIKKWKWNACEFAVDIFPGYCAVQLVDGVSPWKAHASNKKEQSELQKAAQHHGSLTTCFI